MEASYTSLFTEFEKECDIINKTTTDSLVLCIKMVREIEKKLKEIHKWLKKHQFENAQEEIYFFKELKPKLVSKLIYFKTLYKLETSLPPAKRDKRKHYERELRKIKQFAANNKEFYEYFRSRSFHKDEDYFVRRSYKDIIRDDCWLINYNSKLCTSHDYMVATLIANDQLTNFLEIKLEELKSKSVLINNTGTSNLNWTASKVDLIELIYALHSSGVINAGTCEVREIAAQFGKMFNIDIEENIYRAFVDIKSRKTVQTKFLNTISENLIRKMKEDEL